MSDDRPKGMPKDVDEAKEREAEHFAEGEDARAELSATIATLAPLDANRRKAEINAEQNFRENLSDDRVREAAEKQEKQMRVNDETAKRQSEGSDSSEDAQPVRIVSGASDLVEGSVFSGGRGPGDVDKNVAEGGGSGSEDKPRESSRGKSDKES